MPVAVRIAIGLVLVAFPLLEIALLIHASRVLGIPAVLLIVIGTALAGVTIIRRQGLRVLSRIVSRVHEGRGVFEPMLDALIRTAAAMLLIFPGLISDVIGAALLIPRLRTFLIKTGIPRMLAGMAAQAEAYDRARKQPPRQDFGDGATDGKVIIIEGEYERIDDPPQSHTQVRKRSQGR